MSCTFDTHVIAGILTADNRVNCTKLFCPLTNYPWWSAVALVPLLVTCFNWVLAGRIGWGQFKIPICTWVCVSDSGCTCIVKNSWKGYRKFWSYASTTQINVIKYKASLANCIQFSKVLPIPNCTVHSYRGRPKNSTCVCLQRHFNIQWRLAECPSWT